VNILEREKLIKWLESRIKELKEELDYLEAALSMLRKESEISEPAKASETLAPSDIAVITADNNVLANVIRNGKEIRIIFTEGLPKDNVYINSFLLKFLEDSVRAGNISEFKIAEKRGYITELRLIGDIEERFLREMELALKYVWRNLNQDKKQ
jgi:hypothetical protein